MSVRRYGYFECDDCGRRWGSSQVYCDEYDEAEEEQDCNNCDTPCFPYRVEPLRYSHDDDDDEYDDDDDDYDYYYDDDDDDDSDDAPRRRYGFFRCDACGRHWESSHVYCDPYTDEAMYAQDCKHCGTASFPYHVEPIRCSQCLETDCVCTEDDLEEKKRHVDPNKPHMKELCHKCRAGIPCASNHEGCGMCPCD